MTGFAKRFKKEMFHVYVPKKPSLIFTPFWGAVLSGNLKVLFVHSCSNNEIKLNEPALSSLFLDLSFFDNQELHCAFVCKFLLNFTSSSFNNWKLIISNYLWKQFGASVCFFFKRCDFNQLFNLLCFSGCFFEKVLLSVSNSSLLLCSTFAFI